MASIPPIVLVGPLHAQARLGPAPIRPMFQFTVYKRCQSYPEMPAVFFSENMVMLAGEYESDITKATRERVLVNGKYTSFVPRFVRGDFLDLISYVPGTTDELPPHEQLRRLVVDWLLSWQEVPLLDFLLDEHVEADVWRCLLLMARPQAKAETSLEDFCLKFLGNKSANKPTDADVADYVKEIVKPAVKLRKALEEGWEKM